MWVWNLVAHLKGRMMIEGVGCWEEYLDISKSDVKKTS
jgi:hypothetical protein